jgi:two-component system, OmpR family, sensor histidine kinase ChvG
MSVHTLDTLNNSGAGNAEARNSETGGAPPKGVVVVEDDHIGAPVSNGAAIFGRRRAGTKADKDNYSRTFPSRAVQLVRFIFFSSLTRRIVVLNLTALAVLLSSILYLNQFREGLIDARVESLLIQGRIIAGALAASATVETNTITVDPDKLIVLQAGESTQPTARSYETLDSPLKPERIAPVLRTLIQPTRTRARIYDQDGILLLDSRHLYAGGQILRFDLPPIQEESEGMISRIGKTLNRWLQRRDLPVYKELIGTGSGYPEVMSALTGSPSTVVRMTEQGELTVSVAVPVQRFRAVLGALMLSTQGGDIDRIVAEERLAIMRMFLVAAIVIIVLSILLAGTIANPLRKLSEAAIRIRYGVKSRVQIPDFSSRGDEIGNLSQTLSEMTNALYARIEAIESFAADVSHELKNPLTSLRSAVETLPLAKNENARERLLEIIQHDVRRLDRLITDISDASRLDAELAREDSGPVNLRQLLENIVALHVLMEQEGRSIAIKLRVVGASRNENQFRTSGHEGRISQVINNLVDNARSFMPPHSGRIDLTLERRNDWILITVEDNGPGIRAENIEDIFERFYTDRPGEESFGQNSGLGLSISRQIIETHGGTLLASNREPPKSGARFTVKLPAL